MSWLSPRRCWTSLRPLALLVLVGGALGVLVGCGRGTFVGRQYDNFTAYFNTYYNASKAFEKGLESLEQSDPEVDRDRYISIFTTPQAGSARESFKKAVQKSASLLREHPNSKWVDDALILIGRSYFYQQNYIGAIQKFREVVALDAEREGEARFRLAQTLVATERYSEAAEVLGAALEGGEDYGRWTDRMYLVRGELAVRQNRWKEAEGALARGLEGDLPDDVAARAAMLLGQVRETREDFQGALAAYRRVSDYNPKYALEFAAQLNAIEMQGRHGNTAQALQRLEGLKRDDDTKAMRGEMAIVRARLYKAQGERGKARRILQRTLRGEEAPSGEVQGGIHYELGTLFRDAYEDFTRAAAHFDTAATALSSGSRGRGSERERSARVLPRAPSDAQVQADRFQGIAERGQAVARMDSLLRIGRMSASEYQSFVRTLRERRRKAQKAQAEKEEERQSQFRGGGTARRESSRSQSGALDTRGSDAGFLFHQDPTLVQRGRRQFRQTWGDRPLVDNWRRKSAIQNRETTASAQDGNSGGERATEQGPSSTSSELNLSEIPRDSASQAEMEKKRAAARYELANALFRAASRPDSAETWYKRVLNENEDHPVARRALYALAQVHRAQGDTAKARATYRRVIEKYPETPFARRAREQLGVESTQTTADQTASRADSAYAHAFALWQEGSSEGALDSLLTVAETYPNTSAAPRALLAAGVVYHRSVQRDSSNALQARLEQSLDRLTEADSTRKDTSGAAADSTARSRPVSSSPDSASTEGQPQKDTPPVQAKQRSDTSGRSRRPEQRPDTAAAVPDSTTMPRRPSAPSRAASRSADSTEGPPPSPGQRPQRGQDARADSAAPRADAEKDTTAGTKAAEQKGHVAESEAKAWTIVVDSQETASAAQERARRYRNRLPDTTTVKVLPGPEGQYRVGVGVFPGKRAARAALRKMKGSLLDTSWLLSRAAEDSGRPPVAGKTGSADSVGTHQAPTTDSLQTPSAERDPIAPLRQLLTHLTDQYSDTPYAKRAQALLDQLEQTSSRETAANSATTRSSTSSDSGENTRPGTPDSTTASGAPSAESPSSPEGQKARPGRPSPPSTDTTRRTGAEGTPERRDTTRSLPRDSTKGPDPDSSALPPPAAPTRKDSTGSAEPPLSLNVSSDSSTPPAVRRRERGARPAGGSEGTFIRTPGSAFGLDQ